jgi:hypothetical protein
MIKGFINAVANRYADILEIANEQNSLMYELKKLVIVPPLNPFEEIGISLIRKSVQMQKQNKGG